MEQSPAVNAVASRLSAYRRKRILSMAALVLLLAVVIAFSAGIGSVRIPVPAVWSALAGWLTGSHPASPGNISTIVLDVRLPRIILAALVGAALATAGATYQGLFRNPLADPYLIGVAQGAGLGATIGFLLPASAVVIGLIPTFAFAGALVAVGLVYVLARVGRTVPLTTLILAGVAMGAFLASVTSYLMLVSGEQLRGILLWIMGGFSLANWGEVRVLLPYVIVGMAVIYLFSRPLNLMQLDEEQARQMGVNVEQVKIVLLLAATLVTAGAVSFAGIIGFVGIIIPHAVRLVWGPDYRYLLPLSSLCGAIFLVLADSLARVVLGQAEVPVGVVTAFCGAPFFLYLLRSRKKAIF